MNKKTEKWLLSNTESLKNKTVALTGATGGIGRALCKIILELDARLILTDRNKEKSLYLKEELLKAFPSAEIEHITADLSDINSVKKATEELKKADIDIFIHNAGAYSIPRYITDNGFDNVFHINFLAPYYMIKSLLPHLSKRQGKVIVTGSIAHRYSKTDVNDVDFKTRKQPSLVYGNAKRFLMFSLDKLFEEKENVRFSLVHPGISFTGITNHYPKLIFALIKKPMKIIFMKPDKACLSTVMALFKDTLPLYWIGPRFLDVWGMPKYRKLKISEEERKFIFSKAEEIYNEQN